MKIEEMMSRDVAACGPSEALSRAAQLMWEHDCGFVPVVEGEAVVGVVTDRDACMAAYTKGLALGHIAVADVMSREVLSCAPQESVDAVRDRMAQAQVRRLPVLEEGRLVGVVSLNDLALAAANGRDKRATGQVAQTLAAISRHRPTSAAAAE